MFVLLQSIRDVRGGRTMSFLTLWIISLN